MVKKLLAVATALGLLSYIGEANAYLITNALQITALDFIASPGSTSLSSNPFYASFSITYDPYVPVDRSTYGITVNSISTNTKGDFPIGFSAYNSGTAYVMIGSLRSALPIELYNFGVTPFTDSFVLTLANLNSMNPTFLELDYSTRAGGLFTTNIGSVEVSPVPLPTPLPMFGILLIMFGILGYFHKNAGSSIMQRSYTI